MDLLAQVGLRRRPLALTLTTPRLTLRPLGPEDAEALVAGVGNYDVSRWLAVVPYPYGRADAEAFLASSAAAPGRAWAICDDDGLQGVIAGHSELGYWLARPAWGKGYVTEAGDAVIDRWFADPRAPDLTSGHFEDNARSRRVLEKLGFAESGQGTREARALAQTVAARDMVLTRAAWRARRRYRLATPRLSLREMRPGDLGAVLRIGGDVRVARMLSSVAHPWDAEAAQVWIARSLYRGRPGFRLAILRRGRLIGSVGFGKAPGETVQTVGYFLDPAHWGRGYATEAVGALLADVLPRFGIDSVEASAFADNPASARVLTRVGFHEVARGLGRSGARLEPAEEVTYRLHLSDLKATR
ncbi:N-acetyltransferase [Rhodobacteraceae bacterium CCMM004]|nr:N-acetyltransferase [Rhodobacteraceae bacterium CCMM004]